ncbi:hypothetical protein VPH35_138041 [Triticum aestivum]
MVHHLKEAKGKHVWCRPEKKLLFAMWKALPLPSWGVVGLWTAQRVNIARQRSRFVTRAHMGFREICGEDGEKGWPMLRDSLFSAEADLCPLCAMSSCGGVRLVLVYIYGL